MDGELVTAIVTAAIGAVATGYAARQAHIARGAARSAEAQVGVAQEQVRAAREQIAVAVEQVDLMRRQIEGEEEARKEARGPQFAVESASYRTEPDLSEPRVLLVLKQTSGPALRSVRVSVIGEDVDGIRDLRNDGSSIQHTSSDIGAMASGGTTTVHVDLRATPQETKILLHLECHAQGGAEVWQRALAQSVERGTWKRGFSFR